jgi:hypothetical protein
LSKIPQIFLKTPKILQISQIPQKYSKPKISSLPEATAKWQFPTFPPSTTPNDTTTENTDSPEWFRTRPVPKWIQRLGDFETQCVQLGAVDFYIVSPCFCGQLKYFRLLRDAGQTRNVESNAIPLRQLQRRRRLRIQNVRHPRDMCACKSKSFTGDLK